MRKEACWCKLVLLIVDHQMHLDYDVAIMKLDFLKHESILLRDLVLGKF
jgi:hypothetical protein